MNWDFSLANYNDVWGFLVQIGLLLLFLLLGNILRNIIPWFKKSLIPSALIGGGLLLLIDFICKQFNVVLVDNRAMQIITYHSLGIGFAAMTLKTEKAKTKMKTSQVMEFGALQGGTYMLQAFVGLLITIILFLFTKTGKNVISYISGLLLPLAFGQGPGNALTWDINFTNSVNAFFNGQGSVGLSLASIGFIVASLFGIIYINYFKRKGLIKIRNASKSSEQSVTTYCDDNEIPDSESIDKFSIQMGLVVLVYALSFGFMCLLGIISNFTNSIAWGFNFMWAAIFAMLVKTIIKNLKKNKTMKRTYINNYQMDRISGFFFDIMIVAGVTAIEINNIKNYILPIIILTIVGALITFVYIHKVSKHCFKGFEHETFLMAFGTLTGTASNGMILMKEIDPNLITPTSTIYVLSNFPAMVMIAPLLLLLPFASASFTNACIACGIFFVLWLAYSIFIFRRKIFKKRYKNKPQDVWIEKENN